MDRLFLLLLRKPTVRFPKFLERSFSLYFSPFSLSLFAHSVCSPVFFSPFPFFCFSYFLFFYFIVYFYFFFFSLFFFLVLSFPLFPLLDTWLNVSHSHKCTACHVMCHPTPNASKNMKFRLSWNPTKFDGLTRFRETNSTVKSVSSSKI